MADAIVFVENYSAGGSDMVAKLISEEVPFETVYLFVNKRNDFSVILSEPLKPNVKLIKYGLVTIPELGMFARRFKNIFFLYTSLRAVNFVVRYPLILFSILYFYLKFRKIQADIFLSNNGGYPGGEYNRSATISASLSQNTKVFHLFHNIPTQPLKFLRPIESFYDRLLESRSQFIGVADSIVQDMYTVRNFRYSINVVSNGVKSRAIKEYKTTDTVKLLNVGILDDRKNQDFLLDVAFELRERDCNHFNLTLMGAEGLDIGYKKKLKKKIELLELEDCVEIVNFQTDPFPMYYLSDIFVLSSKCESLPMVLLEAMSVGMPIVSTITGDTEKQVVNNYNGFSVRQNDVRSYADCVEFFIKNKSKIKEYGKNSVVLFREKFSIGSMVEKYESLFGIKG